jgi:hypothetical protein
MSAWNFNELFADPGFKQVLREVADEIVHERSLARAEAYDAVAWAVGHHEILLPIYCAWDREKSSRPWPEIKTTLRGYVIIYLDYTSKLLAADEPAQHGDERVGGGAERRDEADADRGEQEIVGDARLEEGDVLGVGAKGEVGEVAYERHEADQEI